MKPTAPTRARASIEHSEPRRLARLLLALTTAVMLVVTMLALQPVTAANAATDDDPSFVLTQNDLEFILRQIQISEAHAAGNPLRCANDEDTSGKCVNGDARTLGVRTVDGSENNLLAGQADFGSSNRAFPRMLDPEWRQADPNPAYPGTVPPTGPPGNAPEVVEVCDEGLTCYEQTEGIVYDSDPRTISNLIVDQTMNNPAIVNQVEAGTATRIGNTDLVVTPNTAPDEELSAPFNTFMGFFGQFFDHGLDLVRKGGNGSIFVPMQPDDPLYVEGSHTNFLTLTRATRMADEEGNRVTEDHENLTTPFIDQNQTYSSHPSHQVFLREYFADATVTGLLLEGENGGLATWNDVKAQARTVLGIDLTDADVLDVPLLRTDQYGHFTPGPQRGLPMLAVADESVEGGVAFIEGNTAAPISTENALGTGHAFLEDIAHGSKPVTGENGQLLPRYDENGEQILDEGGQPVLAGYDNVALGEHFVAGDGRVNENIGLTAIHAVFHAEHNRMVGQIEEVLNGERPELESGNIDEFAKAFRGEAHNFPSVKAGEELPQPEADDWSYEERLFIAAKFATEMQYQHLVFEEFARKVAPGIDAVVFNENSYNPGVDPAIFAEFAHVVYRFGHSMMTDTIGRAPVEGGDQSLEPISLFDGFLNPDAYTGSGTLDPEEAAGSLINGMTAEVGSQIDEHVVDTLRNQLLGIPNDLAAINLMRGRDVGIPSLQSARRSFYAASNEPSLRPYSSWFDFGQGIKNGNNFGRGGSNASLVNFVAAYGTHPTILDATTYEAKREAAALLVNGAPLGEEFILQYAGADRFETAAKVSQRAFPNPGVPVAYLTNGMNFPDALAGGAAAAAQGGPILLTASHLGAEIPSATAVELARLKPERIVILGGENAVSATQAARLEAYATSGTVDRIGGADRFETAALISREFASPGVERVFIANGMNFPDALAGSAVAARDGSPVLLVSPTTIPGATAAELRRLDPDEIVILGGNATVGQAVATALSNYAPSVSRVSGEDRIETAVSVSERFFPDGADEVYIATGYNFADALAGGVAAGLDGSPLLLVNPGGASQAVLDEIARLAPSRIHVLGGYVAVPQIVHDQLAEFTPEPLDPPADRVDFIWSTGEWASTPEGVTTTGLDEVDFWIGGLAERLNPFGGMLGSTFNYVFEIQLENLQFGDRFYYLFRNQGQQLFAALEGNTFADIIQRNTDASNLPADVFALHDPILDLDNLPNPLPAGLIQEPNGTWRWDGDEHVELHGTEDADRMRGDEGDDAIWGYGGNDVIEGGSGNDALVGGHGDDIITDSFGDDNIKGGQGNDAISSGPGIDLLLGGLGDDFIMSGGDLKTIFSGLGNDIILGTTGRLTVFGGEHDDWVEGSNHADLLQGDNADQFQNDVLGGNDIVIGGLGNDDIEGEGGDDILVGRAVGTDRHLGNIGFDWITYYGETLNVNADMSMTRVAQPNNPLPSRFDQLEALSGGAGNDTLRGPLVEPDDIAPNEIALHRATQESLDLIEGLEALLRPAGAPFDYAAPLLRGTPESDSDGVHKIMIGGPGNDLIEGRGGNDYLDGDAMLRVQLRDTVSGERYDSAAQVQAAVFRGEVNPGQLEIVRDIVMDPNADTAVDTAFYRNSFGSYTISQLPDGYWRVEHTQVQEAEESDGTDVIRGFEVLQFSDGCAMLNDAGTAWEECETTGQVLLDTANPVEDQPITATIADLDGNPLDTTGFSNVQYTWWAGEGADAENITEWEQLVVQTVNTGQPASPVTFTPGDDAVGSFLRVTVSYVDAGGIARVAASTPTTTVVENVNDVPTAPTIVVSPSGLLTVTPPTDGDGFNEDDPGFTYVWFRNGVAIEGASGNTYTPGAADSGATITVTVSYTDLHGTAESVTSAGVSIP